MTAYAPVGVSNSVPFSHSLREPQSRGKTVPWLKENKMDTHGLTAAETLAKDAKTPFSGESAEYRKAREALLAEEIEFRRHLTRLSEQRRALPPGPVIEKNY